MLIDLHRSLRNIRYKARKTKLSRNEWGRRKLLPKNASMRGMTVNIKAKKLQVHGKVRTSSTYLIDLAPLTYVRESGTEQRIY